MWQYATNTHHKNAPTNKAKNDLTNMWEPARQQHTVAINCFMDLINYINYLKCVVKIWQHIISYSPENMLIIFTEKKKIAIHVVTQKAV